MGRHEIKILVGMLLMGLLAVSVGGSMVAQMAVKSDVKTKWMVEGELQQQNKPSSPSSFWVNGVRINIEDRPDFYAWMEQQVGKQIEIVVRTK